MNKFTVLLGDDVVHAQAESNEINLPTGISDVLEIDCWDLIRSYAAAFGISLTDENGDPIDDDEVDFCCAKAVHEAVLKIFSDAGFVISYNS